MKPALFQHKYFINIEFDSLTFSPIKPIIATTSIAQSPPISFEVIGKNNELTPENEIEFINPLTNIIHLKEFEKNNAIYESN